MGSWVMAAAGAWNVREEWLLKGGVFFGWLDGRMDDIIFFFFNLFIFDFFAIPVSL